MSYKEAHEGELDLGPLDLIQYRDNIRMERMTYQEAYDELLRLCGEHGTEYTCQWLVSNAKDVCWWLEDKCKSAR